MDIDLAIFERLVSERSKGVIQRARFDIFLYFKMPNSAFCTGIIQFNAFLFYLFIDDT